MELLNQIMIYKYYLQDNIMTTSIQFKSGINFVCFNNTDTFSKIFGTSISKVNSISKIKNNNIFTSIIISNLLIGQLTVCEFFTGYNVTCNDSFTLSFFTYYYYHYYC